MLGKTGLRKKNHEIKQTLLTSDHYLIVLKTPKRVIIVKKCKYITVISTVRAHA